MGRESVKFHDVEIEKKEFHCSKSAIPISHVSTDKIVMSEAFPCAKKGSKYFGGYKDNEDVTLFRSMLCNFIEIALRHGCSPVDLVRAYVKNTSEGILLTVVYLAPKNDLVSKEF